LHLNRALSAIVNTPLSAEDSTAIGWRWTAAEVVLIFLLFFVFAGGPTPDVNEAHYLAKAKHYWNPQWCPHDFFLESADAHLVFNWTFGWLTLLLPLPAVAWVGRVLTWGLLAWAWQRLSAAVVPRRLMSLLSAAMLILLVRDFNLAGEWLVGGVEAKGFAFVFVLLGLEALVRDRWRTTWLLLGAASAFHVLVGGWSVIAAGVAWLWRGRGRASLLSMLPALAGGLLLALPGLIPGVQLSLGVDVETLKQANRIYVFERLSHHLVIHEMPAWWWARNGGLLAAWGVLCVFTWRIERVRRANGFVAGAVLIGGCGIAIDLATLGNEDLAAALLRFYWFRLSDVALPLGTSLAVCGLIARLRDSRRRAGDAALVTAMLLAGVGIFEVAYRHRADPRPAADAQGMPQVGDPQTSRRMYEDWVNVCRWIRQHTPPDATFITPRWQQTFKWYAQRSEVVSHKDVPQDARSLVEWKRRMQILYPEYRDDDGRLKLGLAAHDDRKLAVRAHHFGAQYVVVDRTRSKRRPGFTLVYPNGIDENKTYAVYLVPAPAEEPEPLQRETP
jgi:hypothetical protein